MTKETPEFKEVFGLTGDEQDTQDRVAAAWHNFVQATTDALNEGDIPIDGLPRARSEAEAESMGDIRACLTYNDVEIALLKVAPQFVELVRARGV